MPQLHTSESLLLCDRFQVEQATYELDNGSVHRRAVVRHPGSVVIVPRFADGQIGLIRNYRVSVDDVLIELPAGTCEPGEAPLATAKRELLEETGWLADQWTQVAEFLPAPGILDESMRLFVASHLTESTPDREAYEQMENLKLPLEEARRRVATGEIRDAKTIIGLLWPEIDCETA